MPRRANDVLDCLDDAPVGTILGANFFVGRLATIQAIASTIGVSDGTARTAVHALRRAGLVEVIDAKDALTGHRRLFVTGEARR